MADSDPNPPNGETAQSTATPASSDPGEHGRAPRGPGIGQSVGGAVGGVIDKAVGSVGQIGGQVGKLLTSAVGLKGIGDHLFHWHHPTPGTPPGIEHLPESNTPPPPDAVKITTIDYSPTLHERVSHASVEALIQHPRPETTVVRWINIDGLHPYVVRKLADAFDFHPLAAEDVLSPRQRPRVEMYTDELFIAARMLRLLEGDQLYAEQVTMFLRDGLVVTFQESAGDVWDPIRARLNDPTMRLRRHEASFLVYALLDAIVDHGYPILERYGDLLEDLEGQVLEEPTQALQHRIHGIKRELSLLRRSIWPTREVIATLMQEATPFVATETRTYLRDVYEHTVQLVEVIETFREMGSGLTDLYMSAVSNRMNEIMKVLTIMASLFIPITFLAGVYGMNFEHIPELAWPFSYTVFWGVCIATTLGLLAYFWRKGWIG